jgi:hypothetical protein
MSQACRPGDIGGRGDAVLPIGCRWQAAAAAALGDARLQTSVVLFDN